MSKRIIVISSSSKITLLHNSLVVRREGQKAAIVPTDDIGLLMTQIQREGLDNDTIRELGSQALNRHIHPDDLLHVLETDRKSTRLNSSHRT